MTLVCLQHAWIHTDFDGDPGEIEIVCTSDVALFQW